MALYNSPEMQKLLKVQETIEKYNIPEMQATMAKHDIPALREIQKTINLLNSSLPRNALKAQSIICFAQQFPSILKEFPTLSNEAKAFLGTTISIKPRNPVCFDEKNLDKKNVESYDIQIEHPDTKVQQTPSFNDLINNKVEFQKDKDIDTSTVKNQLEEFICVTNEASELIPNEIRKPVKEIQGNINRALLKPKVLTVLFVKNLTLSILLTLSFSGATLIGNLVNLETNVTLNKTDVTQIENNNTNDIIVIQSNPQITINGDVENPQDVIDQCLKRQAELFADIIEATLQDE